jgi:hypothetical protein
MKTHITGLLTTLALLVSLSHGQGQGTAFTYQGRLNTNGVPYTGSAEFQFTLWDALSGGNAVATNNPVAVIASVANGLFTATLDFGSSPFGGPPRFLQIDARTTIGAFTPLTPRQPLTPTPYAITASNLSGTLPVAQLSGAVPLAQLPAAVVTNGAGGVNLTGTFTGNGAGLSGVNASSLNGLVNSNIWQLNGNAVSGGQFLGTTGTNALEFKVNGQRALRVEHGTNAIYGYSPNLVGGYPGNIVSNGYVGAVIGGGGLSNAPNRVGDHFATVVGGSGNSAIGVSSTAMGNNAKAIGTSSTAMGGSTEASGIYSTAMGSSTEASGTSSTAMGHSTEASGLRSTAMGSSSEASGDYSTAMGLSTTASNNASTAMGYNTKAIGHYSTAMGLSATASGYSSTAMGHDTTASGDYSTAMGNRAKANHPGAFVWADYQNADFASTDTNQFLIRASGGVGIGTASPNSQLHVRGDGVSPSLRVQVNGTSKLTVAANGGTSIGALDDTPPVNGLYVLGDVGIGRAPAANALEVEGTASKTTATAWLANSDARIKHDIRTVTNALEKLAQVRLVNFRYTEEYRAAHPVIADREYLNVVAQEFREVFPDAVQSSREKLPAGGDEILQVDSYPLTIYSAAAIQELNAALSAKDARIGALERNVAELKELVGKLVAQKTGGAQ